MFNTVVKKSIVQSKQFGIQPADLLEKYFFKEKMKKQYMVMLILSLCYALMVGAGFYGYGTDYYSIYRKANVLWGDYRDRLGWMISTLTINDIHFGVYLVSFILAISTGLIFIKAFQRSVFGKNSWLFFMLYVLLLHTWPVIMSTSNAMRQGISMSLLFIVLYLLIKRLRFLALIASFFMIGSHKSGIFYFLILLCEEFLYSLFYKLRLSKKNRSYLFIFMGIILFIFVYYSISYVFPDEGESRIILGDYRYPFLLINFMYVLVYVRYLKKKDNVLFRFLVIFSFVSPAFLLRGFNWQYERLNMMVLILYIISFAFIFIYSQRKIYLSISIIGLLAMTILNGMYASLK